VAHFRTCACDKECGKERTLGAVENGTVENGSEKVTVKSR